MAYLSYAYRHRRQHPPPPVAILGCHRHLRIRSTSTVSSTVSRSISTLRSRRNPERRQCQHPPPPVFTLGYHRHLCIRSTSYVLSVVSRSNSTSRSRRNSMRFHPQARRRGNGSGLTTSLLRRRIVSYHRRVEISDHCIGSAFNAKGIMQCPNCRKVEMGNWLYANGSRSSQDANNDEWGYDEDFYDVAHPDVATFVPLRIQWCPIGRLPALIEELEATAPATFNDFLGPNFNSEHAVTVPGTAHPAPYVGYYQPVPPPAPSSSHVTERTMDGAAYHDHWNPLAGPSDGRPVQTVHPIDFHHNPWVHMPQSYSQPNNNNGVAEQPVLPVGILRFAGIDSDNSPQRGPPPSFYGNGSGTPRIPSVPPMAPQFIRAPGNINDQFQQSSSLFAGSQRSGGMHPLGTGGSAVPPPENTVNTSFCLFPPASSGPSTMETEDVVRGNQFYAWERDRLAPYPLVSVNNEGTWWGSSQQQQPQDAPEPASSSRRPPGQWIGGAARSPPQENRSPDDSPFRPMHIPRM